MTDRAAAYAALCGRITEAAAHHELNDLLTADALRAAADLMNSADMTSDRSAALVLKTFHVLRFLAGPAGPDRARLAEASRRLAATLPTLPEADRASTGKLGLRVFSIYERNGDRDLLYMAVALLRTELADSPADHPDRPKYLASLCHALRTLFQRGGDAGFLSAAMVAGLEGMSAADTGHPDRALILSNLGNALFSLAERAGEAGQLAGAVQIYRAALAAAGPESGIRAMVLSNLGNALCALATRTGDAGQLAEAVQVARAAADAAAGGPVHAAALSNLSIALTRQYSRTDELALLAEAAAVARAAVDAAPAEHPDRVGFLAHLGDILRKLCESTGDADGLAEAVQIGRAAVEATPAEHPHRAGHLGFLGTAMRMLAEHTGDASLLAEAIGTLQGAVQAAPAGSAVQVSCLSQLGLAGQARFDRTGDDSQLTEAVLAARQAVAATAPGSPESAVYLSQLGTGLQKLYYRRGDTSLLMEALQVKQAALAAIPGDHPHRALQLSSLGETAIALYERTGSDEILAEAIKTYRSALALFPGDHPDRGTCLSNLGGALRLRFKHTKGSQHLAEAIQAARDAVAAVPADDHRRCAYLTNLAVNLQDLFAETADANHGAEAVLVSREAVRAARGRNPLRAECLRNLGWSLVLQATRDRVPDVAELGEARRCYLEAAICTEAAPRLRIEAYQKAVLLTDDWTESGEEALALVEAAIGLIAELATRGLVPLDRERQLAAAGSLAALAAGVAVSAGRPERAVELLEQTRGLLVAEVMDARTSDLSQLRERFPDVAAAFDDLRLRLDVLSSPGDMPVDGGSPEAALRADLARLPVLDVFQARRDAQAAWTELIDRIRQLPGFSGFLTAPHGSRLTEQAGSGPIVYLYASARRCDALILTGDQRAPVTLVPLPDLTEGTAQNQADRLRAASRAVADPDADYSAKTAAQAAMLDILAWLWDAVTGPVLAALGYAQVPGPGERWPRIWWCPVGVLACFPVHAAGHHRDLSPGGPAGQAAARTVMDRVISSYTTTVRGLAYARAQHPDSAADTAVIIAVADAPGVPALPGVGAEADLIAAVVPGAQVLPRPTREGVLAALPRYRFAHFACHGFANWRAPAQSQLIMYDHQTAPLTVSDIGALRLTGSLAYLSACETTLTTPALADEAVHITGAFQLAGYQHVIGTLWPVNDTVTRQISSDFYRRLTGHGTSPPDPSRAAGALHGATRKVRDQYPGAPNLWAGHTHTGT
jgi:tetratricopeptide (TPR) repeat protein